MSEISKLLANKEIKQIVNYTGKYIDWYDKLYPAAENVPVDYNYRLFRWNEHNQPK